MERNTHPALQLLNPAGLYDPAANGYSHVARLAPNVRPACTLIPVPRLALDGMLFEVEALAAVAD